MKRIVSVVLAAALVAGSTATAMAKPHNGYAGYGANSYGRQHAQPYYRNRGNNGAAFALGALALGAIAGLAAQSERYGYSTPYYGYNAPYGFGGYGTYGYAGPYRSGGPGYGSSGGYYGYGR